jgi:alpha-L-rhamnosidase
MQNSIKLSPIGSLASALLLAALPVFGTLHPAALRCEFAADPLGVDTAQPGLSWQVESPERAQRQTAYQVLAASTAAQLAADRADLWDSGKVASDATTQITYNGVPLKSSQQVFWKIRAWDQDGKASAWSKLATFTLGVLSEADWQAQWIGAATNPPTLLLRREFTVKPGLRRAVAHVCGLGQYELSVNGTKSGDDLLSPGWTKYDMTCLYDTHDLTPLLRPGANAVGLFLGNGMYNVTGGRYVKFKGSFGPLKAIAQLRLEYADGSVESIGTDASWRCAPGPITFSCVFGGEDYDARLEPRGWDGPGFNDSTWPHAQVVASPGGKLRGLTSAAPPLRAIETIQPVKTTTLTNGATVYDLGQNAPIMIRLTARGPAGSVVRIIPAELVKADGSVERGSAGGGKSWWQYTLRGEAGGETYFPKFFYHGCRYLQVETMPASSGGGLPSVTKLEGVVVHTSSEPVGDFACSNELFNRIRTLIRWAQRANLVSVISDCPHRERLGWLEQYHLNGPSLRYEHDLARVFAKGMNDMADSQLANGLVPTTAPEYTIFNDGNDGYRGTNNTSLGRGRFGDSPEWSSAALLVPWQQYQFTGDLELLRRHYDVMARYVAFLGTRAQDGIVSHGLGDWYDIGPKSPGFAQLTPPALTATAFYYQDAWILAQTAALLGKTDDAKKYETLAAKIRAAFNAKFFDPAKRSYSTGSQCANAIPLVMDLVEPANRAAVVDAIVADVQSRGNAITAGDVGYRYLLRALADGGRSDVIFAMNNQSEKPGYGYQLKMGATSLTEAWDAGRGSSQNHFMLGQIMEWFYHDLAGIGSDPAGPGFKQIIIAPQPVGDVTWCKATYRSARGPITSDWSRDGDKFTLRVTIPANTTATVMLPGKAGDAVNEGGGPPGRAKGVTLLRQEGDRSVFHIGSGSYAFEVPWPQ